MSKLNFFHKPRPPLGPYKLPPPSKFKGGVKAAAKRGAILMAIPDPSAIDYNSTKPCSKCGDVYRLNEYQVDLQKRDNKSTKCKPCLSKAGKRVNRKSRAKPRPMV